MTGTVARRLRRTSVAYAGLVVLLAVLAYACSGGDDDDEASPADSRPAEQDEDEESSAAETGPHEPPSDPDLDQELATVEGERGYFELVVNEVRRDGDEIVVWVTITNVSDETQDLQGIDFVRDRRAGMGSNRQVEGMYLVDWATQTAYYPMSTEDGECRCSELEEPAVPLQPAESLSLFAIYNGLDEFEDGTLVVPGFLPADGLSAT